MMRYKLVIAEKPSVAQSLAAVIGATARKDGYLEGNGWRVSWCVGHLAGLADADSYDPKYAKWRYDDLPILPEHWQMVVGKDKKKQFDILKKLMNAPDVTEVVNACDAGREGELIFRSVYELAGCQKPMKRLWISSMEDSAIREGFANLRPGADYDGLHQAALCRAKADWLVGINATRLFSVLYHRTLNIGRVMSPTLALIVQREAEIDTFNLGNFLDGHAQIEPGVDTPGLDGGQLHQRGIHFLPQQLLLQDFLRGEWPVEGIVFNAILPVQRVVGLVPVHPALIGGIVLLLAPDHGQDFLGHVHKDIGFIHIGIQLPKIDLLHYVPPFRFTG